MHRVVTGGWTASSNPATRAVRHAYRWARALAVLLCTALPARAVEIEMIAPAMPPHFDAQGHGRIADVVRAALARCGHRVRFTVVPFGRHWADYEADARFGALATAEGDQSFTGYSSKPFMHLQDGATVLVDGGLQHVASVADLAGRAVVAFPHVESALRIESAARTFASLSHRADRYDQVRMLLAGHTDAILADGLVTAHFIQIVQDRAGVGEEPDIDGGRDAVFRPLFAALPQRLYFRDERLRDDFDRCVAALDREGALERIAAPYVERYRSIVGTAYPVK